MKLFIVFGACAALVSHSFEIQAQARRPAAKLEATRGLVITDGAAVYVKPDFDSAVVGYLNYETQVTASVKSYSGVGGLGLFHKIVYQGKSGFIVDTDIRLTKKNAPAAAKGKGAPKKRRSKAFDDEFEDEDASSDNEPLYFTRYLGGALAIVNFTEKFSGRKLSDQMTFFGLRMTGPGTLFDGPPLDFNVWLSVDKPGYYNQFSSGSPTGFMLFSDASLILPLYEHKDFLVNYGLGLMAAYTRYKTGNTTTFDSQELRLGVAFDLGAAYRFDRYAARFDIKYYYEKTQYMGFVGSFQTVF